MSSITTLSELLSREEEPAQSVYNGAVESVVSEPRLIRRLTEGDNRHETLIQLTAYSHRLARVFRGLRSFAQREPGSFTTVMIAAETVTLLVHSLSSLHKILKPAQILEVIIPALNLCFISFTRPILRELASLLADCGTLLEHLAADRFGSEIIRQWACSPPSSVLDARVRELWTERLVKMVRSCVGNHDVQEAIEQWDMLLALKTSLRNVEDHVSRPSEDHSIPAKSRAYPPFARMTKLNRDDKKASLAGRQNIEVSFPSLDNDDKHLLRAFDLQIPGSWSTLADVIKCLEDGKTLAILVSVASSFPCNLCTSALSSSPQITKDKTQNEASAVSSNLKIEIVDEGIGVWQIRMSAQALKSIQHMGDPSSATDKLRDMASGCWNLQLQPLAGSKNQRKHLKIPVARTRFGRRHSILWQIDIGVDEGTEVPQQEIKVWEICESPEIPKILDRVIFLQGRYPDEVVRRCRQRPFTVDGVQFPARFDDDCFSSAVSTQPSADLDVRTVDPDTIEMTNKFYALTEPVIQSILAKDLLAEFPFDLSKEEARVIRHFRTASLILGRSGTGKTTCLVIKLVRKYLASKAVVDEKPTRQVLLTRSCFLADKLGSYTRRLIKTLSSESSSSESSQKAELVFSKTAEDNVGKEDVSTLRDHSFPLICTWDQFLQLLEKTIDAFDRQNFQGFDGNLGHRSAGSAGTKRSYHSQLVDDYAFQLDYWPRISHALTKDVSVSLVFAEIMGVIKGSTSSRDSLAPLLREEYLTRSCRLAPNFVLEEERSRVYDIFEMYEILKTERGDVDYVDCDVKILKAVRRDPSLKRVLRSTFDEVYIDEIQDQRCMDIELLLSFVRDGRGFHFAGDTAQAISQDSNFRFSDIKDIFFQHFSATSASANQRELARPKMFTLSKNYRSHQGILRLASLVMRLIWQGFPDTVDKLEPEIGSLNGPRPVLFVGVDHNILRSSDIGQNSLSAETSDFGAEQVILVRDANMKKSLQNQIGDVALVLTIRESKGMEFDDVILWNLFTDCPDQAGLRSLDKLKNQPAKFDPRRQGGMCSELKNLYVAITRARVHLFIMENSESSALIVMRILSEDGAEAFIEVTRPGDDDFPMRVEMLRPGTSLDPQKWYRRANELLQSKMYKDALRSFRKAKDIDGETTAEAYLREEDGRRCNALGDTEGFIRNLEAAVGLFKKISLFGDAVRVLATMGKLQEAAELCFEHELYGEGSSLFAAAGLFVKAADCHRHLEQYSEAADMLRQGGQFDQLVGHLDKYSQKLSSETLRSYQLLCKLLIKQNKVSSQRDSPAIRVLGSFEEQEACFLEYRMDKQLIELYTEQRRHLDLYLLFSRTGQLEKALFLVITEGLLQSTTGISESEVLTILDFVWAGHREKGYQENLEATLRLLRNSLTPKMILRTEQWESSYLIYSSQDADARRRFAYMENNVAKTLLALRNILKITAMNRVERFDDIPFKLMQDAVSFAKDLVLNETDYALNTLLLLTGLWKFDVVQEQYVLLPWSPLRGTLSGTSTVDGPKVAKEWFLGSLASAILTTDTLTRELWKAKWPTHCVHFMTIDFCPRQRNQEHCNWLHQPVSQQDCSQVLEDLLQVNSIFCNLGVMYYRRAMNDKLSEEYLGIKRYWLERLLRELTYLSAVEQNASIITKTQATICHEKRYNAISSFLEDLLYYRLGKEWSERSNYTSLLEQMHFARTFGAHVQTRICRTMSYRLRKDDRRSLQSHLELLRSLKEGLCRHDASAFQANLAIFLRDLNNIDIQALSTLHALTAVFEYFAAYLILKTCVVACVFTQAWIDLYVPRLTDAIRSAEPLEMAELICKYQESLVELTKGFCNILRRFNEVPPPGITVLCSGKPHPSLLLRQRNAELVAIVIANLAHSQPKGFAELWTIAKGVFEFDFVRAKHLRSHNPAEIALKLAPSFSQYNGKDCLTVVIKDQNKRSQFSSLENQRGVKTVLFDQLCPQIPTPAVTLDSAENFPSPSTDALQEEYTPAEMEAIMKFQRLWRTCSRKIKDRRSYMQLPEARAIAHFISLGAELPATLTFIDSVAFRDALISKGVAMSLRLGVARDTLSNLQKDAMTCVDKVDINAGLFESIDDVLHRNGQTETLLKGADRKISDECIMGVVKMGVLAVMEKVMKDFEDIVTKAEQDLLETRKMLDSVSRNCT